MNFTWFFYTFSVEQTLGYQMHCNVLLLPSEKAYLRPLKIKCFAKNAAQCCRFFRRSQIYIRLNPFRWFLYGNARHGLCRMILYGRRGGVYRTEMSGLPGALCRHCRGPKFWKMTPPIFNVLFINLYMFVRLVLRGVSIQWN